MEHVWNIISDESCCAKDRCAAFAEPLESKRLWPQGWLPKERRVALEECLHTAGLTAAGKRNTKVMAMLSLRAGQSLFGVVGAHVGTRRAPMALGERLRRKRTLNGAVFPVPLVSFTVRLNWTVREEMLPTQPVHPTERSKRRHLNFTTPSRPCEQEATTSNTRQSGQGDGSPQSRRRAKMANSAKECLSVLLNDKSRERALQASCTAC